MKKLLSLILLFSFLFIQNCNVLATTLIADDNSAASLLKVKNEARGTYIMNSEIPQNIDIKKVDGKYGVINKDNNETLVPFKYEKIKKFGYDTLKVKENGKWGVITNNNKLVMKSDFDKVYIMGVSKKQPKDIIHSIYFGKKNKNLYATTPGRTSRDVFEKAFNKNNEISWLKFYEYPKQGIIVMKRGNKYGFLMTKDADSWIIMPKYEDFYVQDRGTSIFQQFDISYSNPDYIIVKKDDKWGILNMDGTVSVDFQYDSIVMLESTIDEDIHIARGEIAFTYKSITFPQENFLIAKKDNTTYIIDKKGKIHAEMPTAKNEITFNDTTSNNFLSEIYKENNAQAFVKFENYPTEGIYVAKNQNEKKGLVICTKDGNKIIPNEYEDFKFQDSNTGIFKQLGISFSNQDRILAKKSGKWGIIDSDNNVIEDFKYDGVITLASKPKSTTTIDENGITIKYENIEFPESNLILVKQDKKCGVITRDGEVIIPLKYKYFKKQYSDEYALQDGDKIAMATDETYLTDNVLVAISDDLKETLIMIPAFIVMLPVGIILSPFIIALAIAMGGGC